jgi:hypothetical protein
LVSPASSEVPRGRGRLMGLALGSRAPVPSEAVDCPIGPRSLGDAGDVPILPQAVGRFKANEWFDRRASARHGLRLCEDAPHGRASGARPNEARRRRAAAEPAFAVRRRGERPAKRGPRRRRGPLFYDEPSTAISRRSCRLHWWSGSRLLRSPSLRRGAPASSIRAGGPGRLRTCRGSAGRRRRSRRG